MRLPGAHKRSITGLCFADSDRLLSCGADQTVKLWDTTVTTDADNGLVLDEEMDEGIKPVRCSSTCLEWIRKILISLEITRLKELLCRYIMERLHSSMFL